MHRTFSKLAIFTCAVLLIAGTGVASAQTDVYQVNYFANNFLVPDPPVKGAVNAFLDETVRIDNPGTTYANLCANIYVYDNDQQLTECCSCVETPNGLRTLSVSRDLTSNPLTGRISNNGVVKIVSSRDNGVCDPTHVTPVPALRAWATHFDLLQNQPAARTTVPGVLTETTFTRVTLGAGELAALQAQCQFIGILGSGNGICTCGTGD